MADLYPVNGCRFYIGSTSIARPEDEITNTYFSGVTWIEVDGWETMGEFGDEAALITTPLINTGRDTKQKGTKNAGSMQNRFAVRSDDAGQNKLIEAAQDDKNYPIRLIMNDDPEDGVGSAPGERRMVGLVMSAREVGGTANTVRMLAVTVEINSNIVTVPPVSGA